MSDHHPHHPGQSSPHGQARPGQVFLNSQGQSGLPAPGEFNPGGFVLPQQQQGYQGHPDLPSLPSHPDHLASCPALPPGFVLPPSARSPPSLGCQAFPPSGYFPPSHLQQPPGVFPSTGPLPSPGISSMPHVNQLPPSQQHQQVLAPKEESRKSFGSKAAEWMAKGAFEEAGKGLVGGMFDKFKDDSDDESSVGAAITTGVIGFGVGLLSSDD